MSSYYRFFLSPFFSFFFFSFILWLCHWCRAAEVSHFSTPAHILTVDRIKELGHALPTVAVMKLRHGFTRDLVEFHSVLLASPQFLVSVHHPRAQHIKGMSPPFLTLCLFPFCPMLCLYSHPCGVRLCKREQEAFGGLVTWRS